MTKIVVVEKDKEFREIISKEIKKTNIKYNKDEIYVDYYSSCNNDLLKEIENKNHGKIYILAIDLEDKVSGVDIAKIIRKKDWDSEIIFISKHTHVFEIAYRNSIKIFDFIEKFHQFEKRLSYDIEKIIQKKTNEAQFIFSNRSIDLKLKYDNILYIYRDTTLRKLVIVTHCNSFAVNMSFNEIGKLLDERFKIIHRACIVNVDKVVNFNWSKGYFVLENNKEIQMLSKKYKDTLN